MDSFGASSRKKVEQISCIEGMSIVLNPDRHGGKVPEKVAANGVIILSILIKVAAVRTIFRNVTLFLKHLIINNR